MSEIQSIIDEINEEVKHDRMMQKIKQHKQLVLPFFATLIIGIVWYSSWNENRKKQMSLVSSELINIMQRSDWHKDTAIIAEMAKDAPSELKPILQIIASGRDMMSGSPSKEQMESLIELTTKIGVNVVWKDLASLIYASYGALSKKELLERLEPLTANDRPFRFSALEVMGMFYLSSKDEKKAAEYFQKIMSAEDAPVSMKTRLKRVLNRIKC